MMASASWWSGGVEIPRAESTTPAALWTSGFTGWHSGDMILGCAISADRAVFSWYQSDLTVWRTGCVRILSLDDFSTVATIDIRASDQAGPRFLDMADGLIYVSSQSPTTGVSGICVYDARDGAYVHTIEGPTRARVHDGRLVSVANFSRVVTLYDARTGTVLGSYDTTAAGVPGTDTDLQLDIFGDRIVVRPNDATAYGKAIILDADTMSLVATVNVGSVSGNRAGAVSVEGNWAVVSNSASNSISVIDLTSNTVTRTVTTSTTPQGVSLYGKYVAVACYGATRLQIIDVTTGSVVKSITALNANPWNIAMHGQRLITADYNYPLCEIWSTGINDAPAITRWDGSAESAISSIAIN